jgi:RHS repeat-associated protein
MNTGSISSCLVSLLEETQYYPFGLPMNGISSKAAGKVENKKKFNGYEENKDLDVNWLESFYRTYDPQLGRFWQIDPKPNYTEDVPRPY